MGLFPMLRISNFKFRVSFLLAAAFCLAPSAYCSIAHTAHGGQLGGAHNATTIAVPVTAAAGDSIIVYCAADTSCSAPTDNASPANTYTAGPSQTTNKAVFIFYVLNPTHLPTTVTCNVSGAESACVVE